MLQYLPGDQSRYWLYRQRTDRRRRGRAEISSLGWGPHTFAIRRGTVPTYFRQTLRSFVQHRSCPGSLLSSSRDDRSDRSSVERSPRATLVAPAVPFASVVRKDGGMSCIAGLKRLSTSQLRISSLSNLCSTLRPRCAPDLALDDGLVGVTTIGATIVLASVRRILFTSYLIVWDKRHSAPHDKCGHRE